MIALMRLPARLALLLAGCLLAAGCAGAPTPGEPAAEATAAATPMGQPQTEEGQGDGGTPPASQPEAQELAAASPEPVPTGTSSGASEQALARHPWLAAELTDVLTGEPFRLADFAGKPVVVETMAVWCPTCLRQQQELAVALQSWGDDVVVISLDIDPSEDGEILRQHAARHGFPWLWAVAPREMASQLSAEFGPQVLSPPSTPIFWLDESLEPHLLPFGLKRAPALLQAVGQGS